MIVRDRPEQPNARAVTAGDAFADVRWQAPAPNNSAITGYEVSYNGQVATYGAGAAGITQRITGLANGTAYTFAVRAINGIGASEWSAGTTATPYGTPTVPQNVRLTSSGNAPADLTASWNAPASTGGGAVDYEWRVTGAQGWQTTAGTSGRVNGVGAGTYTLEVRAINRGSNQTGPTGSDSVGVSNPPPPPPAAYICKGGPQGGGNAVVVRYEKFTSGGHRMYTSLERRLERLLQGDVRHRRRRQEFPELARRAVRFGHLGRDRRTDEHLQDEFDHGRPGGTPPPGQCSG